MTTQDQKSQQLFDQFNELIDELYSFKIGSLEYYASRAWRKVDEIAYRLSAVEYFESLAESGDITPDERDAACDYINSLTNYGW